MILSDNLYSLIFKQYEILNIVNQSFLVKKTINEISDRAIINIISYKDSATIQFFFFAINLEPFKKIVVGCIKCTKLCFQSIRKNTNLIERKEIRNISHVIFQILVVGFFHLNNAVFQFNEYKWHTIDEDKDIRSSVVDLTLNPHL